MALQVWLPLNGNLNNQGLSSITVTNNGATVNDAGKIGKCYNFDGSDDYLQFINLNVDNLSYFSISFWCYSTNGNLNGCFTIRQNTSHNFALTQTGLNFRDSEHSTIQSVIFEQPSANVWTHYAIVYDAGSLHIYKNGVNINNYTYSTAHLNSDLNEIIIGVRKTSSGDYYFKGKLNDFRIYDHCLSPKEIKEISKGLIRHYPLKDLLTYNIDYYEVYGLKMYEYLQSDGNAYINTLVPYDSTKETYKIECKFSQPTNVGNYDAIFGAYTNENSKCLRIIRGNSDVVMLPYYNSKSKGNSWGNIQSSNANIREAVMISASTMITENGTTKTYERPTISGNNTTSIFYLFCQGYSESGNLSCLSNSIIYYFRIYDNDELLRYFVPVEYQGEYGMWDLVENKFYGNSNSSGAFSVGALIPYNVITTVNDCSGYGNDGTVVGTLSASTDTVRYNNSGYMNNSGTTNRIEANPISVSDNVFSVSFWVKAEKSQNCFFADPQSRIGIYNGLMMTMPTESPLFKIDNFKTNEWNHIVFVRNGSEYSLYINNVAESKSSTSNVFAHNVDKLWLLNRSFTTNNYYGANASMSDLRVYATALSANDIKELYNTSAFIHNNGTFECYEIDEVNSGLDINSRGVTETATFYEEGVLDPSYVRIIGTGAPQTTPRNNGVNQCSSAYQVVFNDLSVSKKYVAELDFTWGGNWASGTGGTLRLNFQGSNKPTTGTSYEWSGTNYVSQAIQSKKNPTTLVNNSPTGGTYHYKVTFTIPENNEYNGFMIQVRCDYSDGNGFYSFGNLKIYEYEASLGDEKVKFGNGYITAKQFNET